jgi:hypothetical protein
MLNRYEDYCSKLDKRNEFVTGGNWRVKNGL